MSYGPGRRFEGDCHEGVLLILLLLYLVSAVLLYWAGAVLLTHDGDYGLDRVSSLLSHHLFLMYIIIIRM
jgi:hypothetical protein